MRISSLTLAAALLVWHADSSFAAELHRGRCHMDYCTWFSIEERDLAGTNNAGALFRVVMKGWESHHPNGSYDRRRRWDAAFLPLGMVYGYLETATRMYFAVCHGTSDGDIERAGGLTEIAMQFGYPLSEETGELELRRPEEILSIP
jgi:hypothetical protein